MFGKPVGKLGAVGGRTLIQRAISILRRYGQDAHIYLPGVGMLNGLQAGNYLDSAGTTQGTVDQPVGLVLDAAGGLGAELVTNGDFSGATSYFDQSINGGTGAIISGQLVVTASTAYSGVKGNLAYKTPNATIYVEATLISGTGRLTLDFFGEEGVLQNVDRTGPYTFRGYAKLRSDGYFLPLLRTAGAGQTTVWDNISVREVTGIAAQQPTTANKGVLKLTNGRYNWLFDSTDLLTATYPAGYESVTVIDARSTGQVTTAGANIVGAYSMGPSVTLYGRMIIKGVVPPSDLALLQGFANRLAGL